MSMRVNIVESYLRGMRDGSIQSRTELAREIQLTEIGIRQVYIGYVGYGQNGVNNDCLNNRDKQPPSSDNVFFFLELGPKEIFYTQTKEKESRNVWTLKCADVRIVKKKRRCKAARKAKEHNAFRMWNPMEYKVF